MVQGKHYGARVSEIDYTPAVLCCDSSEAGQDAAVLINLTPILAKIAGVVLLVEKVAMVIS